MAWAVYLLSPVSITKSSMPSVFNSSKVSLIYGLTVSATDIQPSILPFETTNKAVRPSFSS